MPKINFRHTTGFTLIEVLVSMIILALGLLGLASLQGISLKNNLDAYLFGQANALGYEMSDLIKANNIYWSPSATPYTPPPLVTTPPAIVTPCPTCDAANPCDPPHMAAHDYCYWQQKAIALSTNATVTISRSPKAGSTTCTGSSPSLCLTMTWPRTNQDLSASMNTTNYELEVTP